MFNQDSPMNTDFTPILGTSASSDSRSSTPWNPWNQPEWQAFNQVPDPINDPETNLAGWKTSLLCLSIKAFYPIDVEPSNANAARKKCPEKTEDTADTTLESQDSTLELTSMTSIMQLSRFCNLTITTNWD